MIVHERMRFSISSPLINTQKSTRANDDDMHILQIVLSAKWTHKTTTNAE